MIGLTFFHYHAPCLLHPIPYPLQPFFNTLSTLELVALTVLFFFTSVIGVVTGSNSLITVPVMFQFGIDPRIAVATNMFGLTLMAVGGTLPFLGKGTIDRKRLPSLIILTLVGSASGAVLLLVIPNRALPLIISASMIAVALFTIIKRDAGLIPATLKVSRTVALTAYALTLALGIYGGFFSGGYVTLLTAVFVMLFRMTFVQAVSTTKIVNVFSSLVATIIFMARGLVDYKLGILFGLAMFCGAFVGARISLKLDNIWIRRIFLGTVVVLAMKILLYDFLWKGMFQ